MIDPRRIKAAAIREQILALATDRRASRPVDPSEVARALVGTNEKLWRQLMKPIKDEVIRLAEDGRIVILRKNRPVPPREVRGLYRFRLLGEDEPAPTYPVSDDKDPDDDEFWLDEDDADED
ncbi:DUF3253 domain-containing protein [Chthonobacter rhizosphaerae]|uniref:DUF3253 domain-containing protein n=1 Tax=Chthonobacter rhizosphaerae TaxID=2735553 RepID=UPI0015EF77C6|nr:DUF3253 domain-containing protein [Chthonobacter rhizosphaerae]